MIYNRDIINAVLKLYDEYNETIRFNIEKIEELLNEQNKHLIEECYLFIQSLKTGLYDAMIFDEEIDRHGYITYLIEEQSFKEDESVFMVSICQNILEKMGYYFEIPEFSIMLEKAYEDNDLEQLFIIARTYFEGFGITQDYEKAYEIYSYLYNLGYDKGASYLGYMCEYGLGVNTDLKKAYMYYSNTQDDLCYYYLGLMYLHGKYIERNTDKALECFKKSEYDDSYLYEGILLENKLNYSQAFNAYQKGAKLYQEECLYKTGQMLYMGIGVEKNIYEARKYLEYGYYFSHGDCAYELASMILEHRINETIDTAIQLLKEGVSLKNHQSCITLANFYKTGQYIEKDPQKAIYYYQQADKINEYINKKIKEGINE